MIAWLLHLWERVRSSLWFVPTTMSLAAGALALLSAHLDVSLAASSRTIALVYPGDQHGARTLLATVASSMMCRVGQRTLRAPQRRDSEGRLRLIVDPIDFEGLMDAAFNQIRQSARAMPAVSIHMLEMFARIGRCTAARKDRLDVVRAHAECVLSGALSETMQERDRRALERRYEEVLEMLERPG